MLKLFIRHWWFLAARAVLALMFGLIAFSVRTLVTESYFLGPIFLTGVQAWFAVFAVAAGLITVAAAFAGMSEEKWWILLLDGIASIAAGIFVIAVPGLSFASLVRIIALWGAVLGILECIAAMHLRRHLKDEWILAASGIGTMLFAFVLITGLPKTDPELLIWLSWFSFFSAGVMATLAIRMRGTSRHVRAERVE